MRQVGMPWWFRGLSSIGAARFGCYPLTLLRNFSSKAAAAPVAAAAAAVYSPSPPWLILPPGSVDDSDGDSDSQLDREHYHLFSVAEKKVLKIKKNFGIPWRRHHFCPEGDTLCFGSSSYGWQAFLNQRNCKLFLFNPLGNPLNFSHTFIPLPPVESFQNCISSCHRLKIISTTDTTEVRDYDSEYNLIGEDSPLSSAEWVSEGVIDKLVLSSPPLTITSEDGSLAYNEDCLLMARSQLGLKGFVCCRPGDTAWTSLHNGRIPVRRDDFIYFSTDQLFYSLSNEGVLESWDVRRPNSVNMWSQVYNCLPPKLQPTMDEHQIQLRVGSSCDYHLVDSSGDLLLVVRSYRFSDVVDCNGEKMMEMKQSTVAFDVYKFDFVRKKWVYVPNLGDDRVLFLGLNSFSVSLSDDPRLQGLISGNLIYFSFGKDQYHDSGVYNLNDGSITTFLPKCASFQKNQFSSSPPIWIHPQH